jgi:hypothetical protein
MTFCGDNFEFVELLVDEIVREGLTFLWGDA